MLQIKDTVTKKSLCELLKYTDSYGGMSNAAKIVVYHRKC
jgi:hypothetical protein